MRDRRYEFASPPRLVMDGRHYKVILTKLGGFRMRKQKTSDLLESLLFDYARVHWRYWNGYKSPDEEPIVRVVKQLLGKDDKDHLTRDGTWYRKPEQKQIGNPQLTENRIGPNARLVCISRRNAV